MPEELTLAELETYQRLDALVLDRGSAISRLWSLRYGHILGVEFGESTAEIQGTDRDGDGYTLVVPVAWFTVPENELPALVFSRRWVRHSPRRVPLRRGGGLNPHAQPLRRQAAGI